MYQQLWGYKVEDKLYLGVREQKRLNTTGVDSICQTSRSYIPSSVLLITTIIRYITNVTMLLLLSMSRGERMSLNCGH
jgi:hypothetical protein